MAKHPKIPEHCKWFFLMDGSWLFGPEWAHRKASWSHDSDFPMKLDSCDSQDDMEKSIIAAVARCAWNDELRDAGTEMNALMTSSKFDEVKARMTEARNNAEAWRLWGRGEPWE